MPTSIKKMGHNGHDVSFALLACGQAVNYEGKTESLNRLFRE